MPRIPTLLWDISKFTLTSRKKTENAQYHSSRSNTMWRGNVLQYWVVALSGVVEVSTTTCSKAALPAVDPTQWYYRLCIVILSTTLRTEPTVQFLYRVVYQVAIRTCRCIGWISKLPRPVYLAVSQHTHSETTQPSSRHWSNQPWAQTQLSWSGIAACENSPSVNRIHRFLTDTHSTQAR